MMLSRRHPAKPGTVRLMCLLTLAALGASAPAQAQTDAAAPGIYRCGNSYSDTPCPSARQVDADDSRSDEQRRQAEKASARQARLATALANERQARERATAGQAPGRLGPTEAERELAARQARSAVQQKAADKGRKLKRKPPRSDSISRAA